MSGDRGVIVCIMRTERPPQEKGADARLDRKETIECSRGNRELNSVSLLCSTFVESVKSKI